MMARHHRRLPFLAAPWTPFSPEVVVVEENEGK